MVKQFKIIVWGLRVVQTIMAIIGLGTFIMLYYYPSWMNFTCGLIFMGVSYMCYYLGNSYKGQFSKEIAESIMMDATDKMPRNRRRKVKHRMHHLKRKGKW